MNCLNPITISTRSKILAPAFNERLQYEVRCGKCANCQTTLQREWYYRAFWQFKHTVANNGYMLMDCLTYDNQNVPRLSRYVPNLPSELDYMCFDYFDLRYFLVRLRRHLTKKGYDIKDTLKYFASAEYGTDNNCTHRPHLHILFYCTTPNLDNITLSRAISDCWHYGRTDGVKYKGKRYVDEYTIKDGLVSSQRVCKYVSKYVMKDSAFQSEIDKRVNNVLYWYYQNRFTYYVLGDWCFDSIDYEYRKPKERVSWSTFESFLKSQTAKKLISTLKRYMNQFHRQSAGFGLYALDSIDKESVIDTNLVTIADSKQITMRLGLPTYFRRKLFYQLVEINGLKSWILKDDEQSKRYKLKRDVDKRRMLLNEFEATKFQYRLNFDSVQLTDYVLNQRYRNKDRLFDDELNVIEKLSVPNIVFNYSTPSDISFFHGRFLSSIFLGSSLTNYVYRKKPSKEIECISFFSYVNDNSFVDAQLESYLDMIKERKRHLNDSIQLNYNNLQRLNQVYKNLYSPARAR